MLLAALTLQQPQEDEHAASFTKRIEGHFFGPD
jgi:hypothetical protein